MLSNQRAVVTGANRGIGRSIVENFQYEGAYKIYACMRDAVKNPFHWDNVIPIELDFNEPFTLNLSTMDIEEPDILVNNAGTLDLGSFMLTKKDLRDIFYVNVINQLYFTRYIAKKMIRKGAGNIINIASVSGIDGDPGRIGYSMCKAAMVNATKVLSKEFAPFNIRVNAVAPGLIKTDMLDQTPENEIEEKLKTTCMKRRGFPDEVANVVTFLASDLSTYITGQVIRVDGGMYG